MKEKPTGFVAKCQCDMIIGVIDYERTDPKIIGKMLGKWIADGCTIEPRFGGRWEVEVKSCKCGLAK